MKAEINNASISAGFSEPGSAQYSAARAAVALSEQFLAEVDAEALASVNPLGRVESPMR
jgi:hypothetical protein